MKIGHSRTFILLICIWCGLITSFSSAAQNHTEFLPIALPSQHVLESNVQFGQDAQGQIWLVSERGLSVYRDIQFVSFRTLELGANVISASFIGNNVILATKKNVFQVSLSNPTSEVVTLWQINDKPDSASTQTVLSLLAPKPSRSIVKNSKPPEPANHVYVYTSSGIYSVTLPNPDIPIQQHRPQFSLLRSIEAAESLSVSATSQGLLLLEKSGLLFYSSIDETWQSVHLNMGVKSVAEYDHQVYLLRNDGRLFVGDPFGWVRPSGFKAITELDNVEGFISGESNLFIRQDEYLRPVSRPELRIKEASLSSNVYLDRSNNIWLSTPFDIQVAWWQPLTSHFVSIDNQLERFGSQQLDQSGQYAVSRSALFQLKNSDGNLQWQAIYQFDNVSSQVPVERVINTDQYLWLVRNNNLQALDKQTLTISHEMPRQTDSLILPNDRHSILSITGDQIQSITGEGRIVAEQAQCLSSCLPNYKISDYLRGKGILWLATNKGLHSFSLDNLTFSEERLDSLNQLSPLLSLQKANEETLWLVYPNKVAAYNMNSGTSALYYSQLNRIFDAKTTTNNDLLLNTQRGWVQVSFSTESQNLVRNNFVVQQVYQDQDNQYLTQVKNKLVLADDQDELQLAFNIGKQHPAQTLMVRFKYKSDQDWTVVSMFNRSLTLKNLRQGANQLQLQARLEGQNWQHAKTLNYILPYRFFQTKWVIVFIACFLLALLMVIAYERLNRVKVMFKTIKQQAFISSLLDSTREGVWIANQDREIQSVNQAFSDITGFSLANVEGKSFQLLTDFGRNHEVESLIWQEVIKSGFWAGEVWSKKADGEKISIDMSVTRVESEDKLIGKMDVKYVGVFSDVTSRKKSERDLRQLATRDPLTNLANRTLFIEHVKHSIETISPANPHFAVMFIDLDNFKKVNESLGPLKGDEFLQQVAQRLADCLPKGISIARLGGDEFALLIPNHLFSGVPAFFIKRVATDIQRELQPAFYLDRTEISITASIGVSIFPNHGDKPELLMRCADTALNRVKITGRNNCLVYDHVMDDLANDKLSLESELISALHNDEFLVYYQPKYKIQQNQVSGFEALVRWQNPNRGLVPPDQFISIAEDNGLIRQLDFWVLRQVCKQIKYWLKTGALNGKVAVNISALNFQQAEFCQSVINLISEEGDLIPYIELEITETAMMRDPDRALESVKTLRSKGFSIALDDFGTGHSSLGYLKRFPIDRIKIDRAFVQDIEYSAQDRNIASVIVQLAKHLGIEVIAEGVESEAQAYLLHVMGCNEIQGYFISRPIIAEQVEQFLTVDAQKLQQIAHANES